MALTPIQDPILDPIQDLILDPIRGAVALRAAEHHGPRLARARRR